MLRYLRIAFGTLAMVTVMVLAAGITLRLALHAGEVAIPDLSGLTVQEASDAALHAGLDLNIQNRFYSTTVPAGRILSQAPAPGSEVRKGWQVRVVESLGPQQVTIPDVVGEPVRQATMDLRRNQLDLGTQVHLDAPGDADMVLAQTPPPNAGVDQPRVNLLLSSQAQDASDAFVMPSFVGQGFASANHQAIELGLRVATIGGIPATPPPSAAALTPEAQGAVNPLNPAAPVAPPAPVTPTGPVLTQSPEPGHRALRGETVRLYFTRSSSATASPAAAGATTTTVPTTAAQPPQ
jgi:eukaryotic-like serine/threonine-protein kinase